MTETLEVSGLRKHCGDVIALDGVHLRVEPGRLLGFLGPNGAGKTTTMRAVLRLVELDAGTITWRSRPVGDEERRSNGNVPQERGLYARPLWEVAAAIGLLVASAWLVWTLAGRVYEFTLLRTGSRIPVRDVLRLARSRR